MVIELYLSSSFDFSFTHNCFKYVFILGLALLKLGLPLLLPPLPKLVLPLSLKLVLFLILAQPLKLVLLLPAIIIALPQLLTEGLRLPPFVHELLILVQLQHAPLNMVQLLLATCFLPLHLPNNLLIDIS